MKNKLIKIKNLLWKISSYAGKVSHLVYAGVYILLIFIFAIIYTSMPNNFYHSTVQYENSLKLDENDILECLKNNIIESQLNFDGENIFINDRVSIDAKSLSVTSFKYEENNEVSFAVNLVINDFTEKGQVEIGQKRYFKFSLDSKLGIVDKYSSDMIYYSLLTPIENNNIFSKELDYKNEDITKAIFPVKSVEGLDTSELIISLDSKLFNKIIYLKNAKNGFPSGVSNNFERMFYLSAVTITTVGYGDIVPITSLARTLIALEAILGVVLVGLFLNSLSVRMSNSISKAEKEKEEEKMLPVKVAMYREIQIFLSRIVSFWSDVHYYSVPESEPSAINELFSIQCFNKMGIYLNLNGQPNIFPPTTWWYYFNSRGQEFIEKGEKILDRYNAYLDPEIFRYIHYLVEDSYFISGMNGILNIRNYDLNNSIPRPQYLSAYYPMPDEEILNSIINLYEWCEKTNTELTQEGYVVHKLSIMSSDTPKPSSMPSMLTSEEVESQNEGFRMWQEAHS
jgi:Ion channel.